ncbi:S49 family peptidase [Novosphingobium sp. 9]|uniref:S49 family peptidase n=1 Tax=Novosphingobium sp. 9 TaxID=2025349 RepID=UPI0021B4FF35|nr:S49 family peptidase [Novosphingobium sp. 9]
MTGYSLDGLFNRPAALLPSASALAVTVQAKAGEPAWGAPPPAWKSQINYGDEASLFEVISGVAVIKIHGVLVQRLGAWWPIGDICGIAAYDRLRAQIMAALADDAIDAIALDIDSPGGEVAGCFDLVDTIFRGRTIKPIWAILGENAYSAAYALASAAHVVTVPRTGGTGSVGVIYMHVSFQGALEKAGIKPTLITKGELKGEGSDLFDLSADAFKRLKADVLAIGDLFDATVARNRGMKPKQVWNTQAGTFLGEEGVEIGFADAVMAPDEAFRELLRQLD